MVRSGSLLIARGLLAVALIAAWPALAAEATGRAGEATSAQPEGAPTAPAVPSSPATSTAPAASASPAPSDPTPDGLRRGEVVRVRLASIIHPVAAEHVIDALAEADRAGAEAFVLELDTPGGLLTSTREMSTAMLGAATPVIVFVGPAGAQAASAGFFLLMAADLAAMAPGTNTGAAHPVGGQGEDIEGTMGEKVEQDAAATIRSLAARNGRDQTLAEAAVLESRSFTADEALAAGLIDTIAPDVGRLLAALDGRPAKKRGEGAVLRTADAAVRDLTMSGSQRVRSILAHPNVAYLLLTLGALGLYFELQTPGAVLPGVIGGICLLLGLYSMSVLPVSATGVALLVLAAIFFIAEIKVTSYGLLTVGGVISLVRGSLMLFRDADPVYRVSLPLVGTIAVVAVLVVVFMMTLALQAQQNPVTTGLEGLIGRRAVARTALAPHGKVFVHGEIWEATADQPVAAGAAVEVVRAEGLRLTVRAASPAPVGPAATAPPEAA